MPKSNPNSGSATLLDGPEDDFYRPSAARETEPRSPRAARGDMEGEAGEPFLRARRRVPVRSGLLPAWTRSRWGKILFACCTVTAIGAALTITAATRNFLAHDARFRVESASSILIAGNSQLSHANLLSVFGSDIGRNLFLIPIAQRRAQLEQIPWVEDATVMRILPNQLRIAVTERTPIAFVEVHGRIELADSAGVVLDMSPQQMAARHYSFPVVSGINPSDPLSVRAARMHLYQRFLSELDANGQRVSEQISEIDLTDPEDVRATVPASGSDLLLLFGQEDFLSRWHNYQAHIAEWRQQYPKLASVDLRYDREVVLKMAGAPEPSATSAPAPKPVQPSPTRTISRSTVRRTQGPKHTSRTKGHKSMPAQHAARRAA